MDPNAALENIRSLITSIVESIDSNDGDDGTGDAVSPDMDDVSMLCDTFSGLDRWLSNGGFKPREWSK